MEEKKGMQALSLDDLEQAAGGYGRAGGYYKTVTAGDTDGNLLALRPQPIWDQYHVIAQLQPGSQVFTYGNAQQGTGLYGVPCKYNYVSYNGIWGFVNAACLI